MTGPVLDEAEFAAIQRWLRQFAGIHLSPAKKPLVMGRLGRRLIQCGADSYAQYLRLMEGDASGQERQIALDLLTTNETHFFREPAHFDFLRQDVLARWPAGRPLRVWSAGCSSGQEAYSLAMVLADALGEAPWEVLGSDISSRMLEAARRGRYPLEQAQSIPPAYLRRFCLKGVGAQAGAFMIAATLRRRVRLAWVNLNRPLPELGRFDVILLRNVMIYFDGATKRQVVGRVAAQLAPGGHLIVGHAESLNGVSDVLHMVRPSIYTKPRG